MVERYAGRAGRDAASRPAPSSAELRSLREPLLAAARRHGVRTLRVFGSVARGTAAWESDVDLLVDLHVRTTIDHHLSLLGEAASRVPRSVQQGLGSVPWRGMAGLRNAIAHGYDTIDRATAWAAASELAPPLIVALEDVLAALPESRRRAVATPPNARRPRGASPPGASA